MDTRIHKLAQILVHYSTEIKPGERVLISGTSPAAQPLVQAIYQEALRAGAYAFPHMKLRDEEVLALEATDNPALLGAPDPMMQLMAETADVMFRIGASENLRALSDYPPDQQKARLGNWSPISQLTMTRGADNSLRWCVVQFPTHAYAQAAGMSLRQYSDFLFAACKTHLDNPVAAWQEVRAFQQRMVDYLVGKKAVHVRGENIDLHLSIEGRTFVNASGTRNMPDGEIFTGPVEDSVNGWVNFTYPAYYKDNEVTGIRLEFTDGVVSKATARTNEAFLLAVLDSDDGARRLGEFAIGTNTDIQRFTGSILFDEKIGGTVHMAVGRGYPETGSVNMSSIHWDMICDMRNGGEIVVDGELFYKDGQFAV